MAADFRDAALVLVAHGSTVNAGSGQAAYLHADELRRRQGFAEVSVAFIQQDPAVAGALRRVFARRVFVVPLFISDGWFTETIIPLELGLRQPGDTSFHRHADLQGHEVHYCRPVGSHPSMTDVLRARADGVLRAHPFPRVPPANQVALFIAGHGTGYSRGSRESIERQVDLLRKSGPYAEVHGVFLEETPAIDEVWSLSNCRQLVLVPFFISDGLHTREDIPRMLGETETRIRERLKMGKPTWNNPTARDGKRLWYAGAVGTEPLLADVILQRVREAAAEAENKTPVAEVIGTGA